jgi:Tfp pilus assembly protein PilX
VRRPHGDNEAGYVIVAALWILLIVGLLGSAALAFSLRSIHTSQSDRNRGLALGAADEGADLAGWRMNKLLVSAGGPTIMGFTDGLLASLGCIQVNADGTLSVGEIAQSTVLVNNSVKPALCPATSSEDAGNGASYSYVMETDIDLNVNANGQLQAGATIERRILVTGQAFGQTRRILVTYKLNPAVSPLFERYRYVECSTTPPAGNQAFDAGCADPGS